MKLSIITAALFVTALTVNAEIVSSSKEGGIIKQLPDVGQTVKKGEMLVVFSQTGTDAEIDSLKAEIEISKEDLNAKTLEFNRANTLIQKHSISRSEWESICSSYNKAKLTIQQNMAKMRKLESDKSHCFIPAPYDCKVTKVLLTPNSGTDIGQNILEVERIDNVNKTELAPKPEGR